MVSSGASQALALTLTRSGCAAAKSTFARTAALAPRPCARRARGTRRLSNPSPTPNPKPNPKPDPNQARAAYLTLALPLTPSPTLSLALTRHAPPVLSLHLKRFACDAGEAEARRVAQHVQLPPSLSLASYATPCCGQEP